MKKILPVLATSFLAIVLSVCAVTGFPPMSAVNPAAPNPMFQLTIGATVKGILGFADGTLEQSFAMSYGNYIFIAWPRSGNWGAVLINATSGKIMTDLLCQSIGQKVQTMTMTQLVAALEAAGWKYITSAQLPATLVSTVRDAVALVRSYQPLTAPTILVVPLGAFTNPPIKLFDPAKDVIQQ